MDAQELIKTIDNPQSNASAGLIVILYYLIVYWPRIKDGLGLSRNQQPNLDHIEKNYQLLKLRIELEQIKKDSGLDHQLLEKLEQEMQARLEVKKHRAFTAVQKFIAIPLMIVFFILSFLELQALNENSTSTALDILVGTVFCITIIIIGFWGIPLLQKQKSHWLRKVGFIVFWTFAFYIAGLFPLYIYANTLLDNRQFADDSVGYIFAISVISSLFLGVLNKLPFMGPPEPKNNNI